MRSAGRGTAPTSSRVGPTQGQVFRQIPGLGPSRGRYQDASYAAGRGYVPYRPSSTYMEEEEETFHKNTFGGQPKAIYFQRNDRRSQVPTNEDMHMGEDLGDQYPDDIEPEQTSEYQLHSSEVRHLDVEMSATNYHRNNLIFDQSLGPINNPPSVTRTRMSRSHVSKKPGFQRQGYGLIVP
ncbi:hypothetical protein EIK77_010117 [Talaromyces pinophilus]|nr:hypothetical protein EIK77_010117 [Talaromyces pinophilus]